MSVIFQRKAYEPDKTKKYPKNLKKLTLKEMKAYIFTKDSDVSTKKYPAVAIMEVCLCEFCKKVLRGRTSKTKCCRKVINAILVETPRRYRCSKCNYTW